MEPFLIGLFIGAAFTACAMYVFINRMSESDDDELEDWSEEFYQQRLEEPRAVTRIKSNQLDWEIK